MQEQQAQDLEALVTQASYATEPGAGDLLLFHQLADAELYAPCSEDASGRVQLRTAPAGDLARLLRLFTSRKHPDLGNHYAGLAWTTVLGMVLSGNELDGVQIINLERDWIAYSRGQLRELQARSKAPQRTN
jgi:hypothetical protein